MRNGSNQADGRLFERFVRLCEIAEPDRLRARGRRRRARRAARARRRGRRGRRRRAGPGRRRQPDRAGPGDRGGLGVVLRPPRHRARGRADRGRARRRRLSQRAARRSSAPTTRRRSPCWSSSPPAHAAVARGRPGSSSCSRSPRRTACAGRRSSTSARLRAPFGYVLDHASPIGEVIAAAPTYQRLVAEFEGVEAHAGIRPEDGHSRDRGRRGGDRARWSSGASTTRRPRTSA